MSQSGSGLGLTWRDRSWAAAAEFSHGGTCPSVSLHLCHAQGNTSAPLLALSPAPLHLGSGWRVWAALELEPLPLPFGPPPVLNLGFEEQTIQYGAWSPAGMMTGFLGDASCPSHQLPRPRCGEP